MAYAENFRNFGLGANNGGSNQSNSSNGGVDAYSSMSNEGGLVMGQIGGPHGYPNSSPSKAYWLLKIAMVLFSFIVC